MRSKIIYPETLPTINDTAKFMLRKSCRNELADLWFSYMQKLIVLSMCGEGIFKTIGDALRSGVELYELKRGYARSLLGIGEDFCVIEIAHENGETRTHAVVSFDELARSYFDENTESYIRAIIDRFFLFLWSEGMLLYPIDYKTKKHYTRPADWKYLADITEIAEFLNERYNLKDSSEVKNAQMTAILSMLSSTRWKKPADVKEDDLALFETKLKEIENNKGSRIGWTGNVLTELRLGLVELGRKDILKPIDALETRKDYDKNRRFDFVDTDIYPNLKQLLNKARGYRNYLKNDGLAVGTIEGEIAAVVNFFKYLMAYYPDREIDEEAIEEIFDPNNAVNIHDRLSENMKSARSTIMKIVKFLTYCELFTLKAQKNIPRRKRKVSYAPYRKAMPKEMVRHIVDIIKNRPPLLRTNWSRKKADVSWWPHEVFPIYPLMMLFGYYIPVRGEQVRNLCREKSFVVKEGKLDTIVINTDKNTNRRTYQEIPCVWEDLQVFVPFLQWHKEYFGNIPKVKYHNDENSPWEDIVPLFLTPMSLRPISNHTHMTYHKKVLCQYQLEVMEEARRNGEKHYPKIAWAKEGKEFFKSIEELNRCSSDRMKDIEVMYDLHSLRVTGATRYLESGVGINLVMQLTGHVTPDTLLRIYINMTLEEKKEKLKSAVRRIYFGEPSNLLQSTSDLIGGELAEAYERGGDKLDAALRNNALFSLGRKVPHGSNTTEYMQGVEIAKEHHPSTWLPMVHGICPAVKCPEGREHKCSLCPYLITGKLFINGIVLKANQALAKFQREAVRQQEEERKGYRNQARAEALEMALEEILGWQEIMERINGTLFEQKSESADKSIKAIPVDANSKSAFSFETYETELAYLANEYDAKMIGVEHDTVGLKVLTIKALKIAKEMQDDEAFEQIAGDDKKSIDFMMRYYEGKAIERKGFNRFLERIKQPLPHKI